jgi:hypothetical protein
MDCPQCAVGVWQLYLPLLDHSASSSTCLFLGPIYLYYSEPSACGPVFFVSLTPQTQRVMTVLRLCCWLAVQLRLGEDVIGHILYLVSKNDSCSSRWFGRELGAGGDVSHLGTCVDSRFIYHTTLSSLQRSQNLRDSLVGSFIAVEDARSTGLGVECFGQSANLF